MSSKSLSDKRNAVVILLGWTGAHPRHLAKYNTIYENYEDHIENSKRSDVIVNIIVKQYIAPLHMSSYNLCLLKSFSQQILQEIQTYQSLLGESTFFIIHAFSTGGACILAAMNDEIQTNTKFEEIYYDGIIYDSPHLGPQTITGLYFVTWTLLKLSLIDRCFCYDYDSLHDTDMCAMRYIWCNIWHYSVLFLSILIYSLVFFPIFSLSLALYLAVTCSWDYVCCLHKKLLCEENPRMLLTPTLVLGSNDDHINPVRGSMEFVQDKIKKCQIYENQNDQSRFDENSILLKIGTDDFKSNFSDENELDFYDSNKCYVFRDSAHVRHYLLHSQEYQKQMFDFLSLSLKIHK